MHFVLPTIAGRACTDPYTEGRQAPAQTKPRHQVVRGTEWSSTIWSTPPTPAAALGHPEPRLA